MMCLQIKGNIVIIFMSDNYDYLEVYSVKRICMFMCIMFLIAYIVSLSGCRNHDTAEVFATPDESAKPSVEPVMSDESLITIGFVQVGHESAWREAATESARETFSEDNGYKLKFIDSDNNPDYQKQAVMDFVEQRVDYIVIDPIVTDGWNSVLQAAKEASVKVFVIDRTIDCDESMYEAWFGSDFEAEGEAAGAWLEAYLKNKGRESEEITIVTVAGTEGSAAQKGRTRGFDKYIKKHDNWTKLDEKDGEFTQESGKKVMEGFISSFGKADVVVCHNDNEAWGVMEALDEAGITYGVGGETILISFDAVHDGLECVLEGKINADFECNPLSAPYVEEAIRKLENGEKIRKKTNYIDEACFQAENNVTIIEYAGKTANMITITENVLESRAY